MPWIMDLAVLETDSHSAELKQGLSLSIFFTISKLFWALKGCVPANIRYIMMPHAHISV